MRRSTVSRSTVSHSAVARAAVAADARAATGRSATGRAATVRSAVRRSAVSRSARTATTGVLLVTALLASATACGSSDPDDSKGGKGKSAGDDGWLEVPKTPVSRAVEKIGKTSARIEEKVELTDRGKTYPITITGSFDLGGDKGRLSVDFPSGEIKHMEEVFDGDRVYLTPIGNVKKGRWGQVDRRKAEAHHLLRAPVNDPEHLLLQISTMRGAKKRGTETVDGRPATHYSGTLDRDTLSLRLAERVRTDMDALIAKLGELPVTADAWVDGEGRLVRARISCDMGGNAVKITMNLSDFGRKVTAPVPPAGSVQKIDVAAGILPG
ncbi:LppX_LprAFG lipoprotein [Streptomyces sp. LX-29]|uniref:LppX_LprAFG lipoprotein n=1 Tax=Streptomyces sp. LX-29 TaxID=2900152 RepID=UPI00240D34B3|nr:LppX_LprAFG lipoprotein [Streptomyces sp. LX-29]WFB07921.1 LppX_LprAFG lipoprotein [Streptomyces sp. LX-29]